MNKLVNLLEGAGLLADQSEVLRGLARGFPANSTSPETHRMLASLLMVLSFAALVWLLSRIAKRQERPGSCNNPRLLFRSLCDAHHLDRSQRKLLERLARFRRLEHPAALFLDPRLFQTVDLPADLREHAGQLQRLCSGLFVRRHADDAAPSEEEQGTGAADSGAEAVAAAGAPAN